MPYNSFPTATYEPPPLNFTEPNPIANSTRTDCYIYMEGSDLEVDMAGMFYNSVCEAVAVGYGITLEELELW